MIYDFPRTDVGTVTALHYYTACSVKCYALRNLVSKSHHCHKLYMCFNFSLPTSLKCALGTTSHMYWKTNLLCLALDNSYILLKYIYVYITYIVINKNKLTWLTRSTLRPLPLRVQVFTQYRQVENSIDASTPSKNSFICIWKKDISI